MSLTKKTSEMITNNEDITTLLVAARRTPADPSSMV
jgi:hypothetical protein